MSDTSRSSNNAALNFRECELGILFGNDEVTVKDHLNSSPEGSTVHRRNDWFVEGVSSRYRAKTVRHGDHFLLVTGDLSSETSIITFTPAKGDGELC